MKTASFAFLVLALFPMGCGSETKTASRPELIHSSKEGKPASNPMDGLATKDGATLQRENCSIYTLAFSPDNKLLASGGHEKIVLWNLATGNLVAIEQAGTLDGDKDNGRDAAIAFTSDGKTLAAIGEKSLIKVWDVETKKEKGKFQALGFHSQICFSPDGKTLYGNETRNWDVGSGKELNPLLIKQRRSVYSPNCECVATSEGFSPVKITILELSSGKKSAELPKQDGIAVAVSFPTKRFLSQHEETKKLSVWDFAGKKIADLDGLLNDQCNQIAVSHDGKYLVACIEDPKSRGLFKVWDFATGKELTTLQQNPSWGNLDYHSVAFSKDDKMLAAGSEQGKIAVWTTEVVAGKK